MQTQVQVLTQRLTKTQFFIIFWTIVLAPFEYYFLKLPFLSVLLVRSMAVGSNLLWYKLWFERNFWTDSLIVRITRMVSMKLFVNITNFTILFLITLAVARFYDTGLHFTFMGFVKKVGYVTGFAILATWPYEKLLAYCGFEQNDANEVDIASDI